MVSLQRRRAEPGPALSRDDGDQKFVCSTSALIAERRTLSEKLAFPASMTKWVSQACCTRRDP